MQPMNGKAKIGLTIAGVLAILAAVFAAGGSYSSVTTHTEDKTIHEGARQKEKRIDERVKLHLRPMEVKLDQMDKKIDRLLDERRNNK